MDVRPLPTRPLTPPLSLPLPLPLLLVEEYHRKPHRKSPVDGVHLGQFVQSAGGRRFTIFIVVMYHVPLAPGLPLRLNNGPIGRSIYLCVYVSICRPARLPCCCLSVYLLVCLSARPCCIFIRVVQYQMSRVTERPTDQPTDSRTSYSPAIYSRGQAYKAAPHNSDAFAVELNCTSSRRLSFAPPSQLSSAHSRGVSAELS